jgi:hypothetical protein
MLMFSEQNGLVVLSERCSRMDCRIKSGNDEIETRSRDAVASEFWRRHQQEPSLRGIFVRLFRRWQPVWSRSALRTNEMT